MDSIISTVVEKLLDIGVSEEFFLIVLFLGFGYAIFQRFLRPIKERLKLVPDENYHNERSLLHIEDKKILQERLSGIEQHLLDLNNKLQDSKYNEKLIIKEAERISSEIQEVRQIIAQFQGHMMYGPRSDSFGNRGIN